MALSEEELKRYREEITALANEALTNRSTAIGQRYQLVEREVFDAATKQVPFINPNIPDGQAEMARRQAAAIKLEHDRIIETYMNGVANPGQQASAEASGAVTQAASMLGIGGEGIGGMVVNMISRMGAVGEVVLAGMNVISSLFGSLLGKIGLGDPNAHVIGFGEARQQVRDSQAHANGGNALAGILGANNANLQSELDNFSRRPGKIERIPDNPKASTDMARNTGMDKSQAEVYLKSMTVGDDKKPYEPGKQMAALLRNIQLNPDEKLMAVKMPDNTVGMAVGKLNEDETKFIPSKILVLKDNALAELAPPADLILETTRPARKPTVQEQIRASALIEQTLSDNIGELRTRLNEIEPTPRAKPEALRVLNNALQHVQDNESLKGLQHIVVVLPDKTPAVLSGTYDAASATFKPQRVTVIGEDRKALTRPVANLSDIRVVPTLDGAKAIPNHTPMIGTIAPGKITILQTAIASSTIPGMDKLAEQLGRALKDPQNELLAEEDKIRTEGPTQLQTVSMVVMLPSGKPAILTGELKGTGDQQMLQPRYISQVGANGELNTNPIKTQPISVKTGRAVVPTQDPDVQGVATPDNNAHPGVAKALKDFRENTATPVPSLPLVDIPIPGFPPAPKPGPSVPLIFPTKGR